MRPIEIREKQCPFAHLPGTHVLLPSSPWSVQIFPTKLIFTNHAAADSFTHDLEATGSIDGFTIFQDLERGRVRVHSKTLSYTITHIETEIVIKVKRGPIQDRTFIVQEHAIEPTGERLFLGVTKKQEIHGMKSRLEPEELFPHLFRLGLPFEKKTFQIDDFKSYFLSAFEGLFVPKKQDHLGLCELPDVDAMTHLSGVAHHIRSLFIEEGDILHLKTPFHSGRMLSAQTEKAELDIEWSNHKMRRVHIRPKETCTLQIKWPRDIKSYRIGKERISVDAPISLVLGETLVIDRFMR